MKVWGKSCSLFFDSIFTKNIFRLTYRTNKAWSLFHIDIVSFVSYSLCLSYCWKRFLLCIWMVYIWVTIHGVQHLQNGFSLWDKDQGRVSFLYLSSPFYLWWPQLHMRTHTLAHDTQWDCTFYFILWSPSSVSASKDWAHVNAMHALQSFEGGLGSYYINEYKISVWNYKKFWKWS